MPSHIKSRSSQNISCSNCSARHLCIARDPIDQAEIKQLHKIIQKVVIINKQDHLFQAHDSMKNLYALYQGCCKEYWIDENGNECVTNFYFPGDIIGMESISIRRHLLSVIAIEPSTLCIMPLDSIYASQANNSVLMRLIGIASAKMRNDRSTKMGTTANERVCDFLLNIISRMLERNHSENKIPLPMSQLDISNFLGIAHETVNRIIKNLIRQNIIKIHNKTLTVLDIKKLESLGKLDYSLDPLVQP